MQKRDSMEKHVYVAFCRI